MNFKNLLPAKNRDELRQWLLENHNKEDECWVVVKRGRPVANGTFWYIDAVEEAMCFGWIDRFKSRLQKLLDNTKANIMYGEWNDNGRLLEDLGVSQRLCKPLN